MGEKALEIVVNLIFFLFLLSLFPYIPAVNDKMFLYNDTRVNFLTFSPSPETQSGFDKGPGHVLLCSCQI